MKLEQPYQSPLALGEWSLPPGGEWSPPAAAWRVIQVDSGTGYWLNSRMNQALETGTVVALAARLTGTIRASQLSPLTLRYFFVEPDRLTGLVSLPEQGIFAEAASRREPVQKFLAPDHPIAIRMKDCCAEKKPAGASSRLQLLQFFFEIVSPELGAAVRGETCDAKERLREFLQQTPASKMVDLTMTDLARLTRCTPRHLRRIFQELVGVSFRDKHTELRLARARELLATTETKVLDVALESGYQSISLFNVMFTRHFGLSPSRWRQTQRTKPVRIAPRRTPLIAKAP